MSKKNKYLSENELIETLKTMGITEKDGKEINADNFTRNELIALIEVKNSPTSNTVEKEVIPEIKKEVKSDSDTITITPKKDWFINCPPHKIQLIKDVEITITKRFERSLKIEKVI